MKIFLSSTYQDLFRYRRCVIEAVDRLRHSGADLEWLGMEAFGARDDLPLETCLKFVDQCNLYVGVFGVRYGAIDRTTGLSLTELEYRRAVEKRKPRLIFIIDEENARVAPRDVEPSSKGRSKLGQLKKELQANRVVDFFATPEDLASKVATALLLHSSRVSDEVIHGNRLKELGMIAAGVAHEIRNPLASILTFAELLPDRMGDKKFLKEFGLLLRKDAERIRRVVESMLAFARTPEAGVTSCRVIEVVEETLLLMHSRVKSKKIQIAKQCQKDALVQIDRHLLLQVLVNLISNAVDAVVEGGKIKVTTGERSMDVGNTGHEQMFSVIEVADNGAGIPNSVRPHLFVPFFTTKKHGTGLGLAISQKIVRDHGGLITYSTVEGKGSSFSVNLPLAKAPMAPG
jgi:signal transduction histidine kinase